MKHCELRTPCVQRGGPTGAVDGMPFSKAAEDCRRRAEECLMKANLAPDSGIKREWIRLADHWYSLASVRDKAARWTKSRRHSKE